MILHSLGYFRNYGFFHRPWNAEFREPEFSLFTWFFRNFRFLIIFNLFVKIFRIYIFLKIFIFRRLFIFRIYVIIRLFILFSTFIFLRSIFISFFSFSVPAYSSG